MGGWAALLAALLSVAGPNGFLLHPALSAPEVRARLPTGELAAVVLQLYVVHHRAEDWPRALYVPAAPATGDLPSSLYPLLFADSRFERPLPGLRVPRLFLYAPHHRDAGRPRPVLEMPLDVASEYFNALLTAAFDLRPELIEPLVESRAGELMREAPAAERAAAYRSALGDFGAHALATAAEIVRSLARQRAADKDPCLLVDHPATLFGLWGRIFEDLEYFGFYRSSGGDYVRTRAVLERHDKRLFVERVLAGGFAGEVRRDFGLDCP